MKSVCGKCFPTVEMAFFLKMTPKNCKGVERSNLYARKSCSAACRLVKSYGNYRELLGTAHHRLSPHGHCRSYFAKFNVARSRGWNSPVCYISPLKQRLTLIPSFVLLTQICIRHNSSQPLITTYAVQTHRAHWHHKNFVYSIKQNMMRISTAV